MKKKMKISIGVLVAFIVFLIVLYNFAISQYCIKKIILPIVAEKTNSKISVENINVSPMGSSIMMSNLMYSSPEFSLHSEKLLVKSSIYDLLFNHKINIKKLLLRNTNVKLEIADKTVLHPETSVKTNRNVQIKSAAKVTPITKKSPKKKETFFYKVALNDVKLDNLNVVVQNKDTVTSIQHLNLSIPKMEAEKKCFINLDGKISMSDGRILTDGFIKSKSIVILNDDFMPRTINSTSSVNLNGHKMPLSVILNTNKDGSFQFNLKGSDIVITPFISAFVPGAYSKTDGKIKEISVDASGRNVNDLLTADSPVSTSVSIKGVDIALKNKFYINNKSIKTSFDLASIIKGNSLPSRLNIQDLNAKYLFNDQLVKVDNLNIGMSQANNELLKTMLNMDFKYKTEGKELKGSVAGNISLKGIHAFKIEEVDSVLNLLLNGYKMPIILNYKNNEEKENLEVEINNFDSASVGDFINSPTSKLTGKFSSLNIALSANGIDSLQKGFQKNSNVSIDTLVRAKKVKINEISKYSADIPDINISLDLNKFLNEKYYINSFKVDDPTIVFFKTAKQSITTSKPATAKPLVSMQKLAPVEAKSVGLTKTVQSPKVKNIDIDVKNLDINNLRAEIISDKKVVFSDVNLSSKEIKTDTLSTIILNLNYTIDSKIKGSLKTNNDVFLTHSLVPEVFKSNVELFYGEKKSVSNIDLKCKQASGENLPFTLNVTVKDLLLDPFLMIFVQPPYNMARTNVSSLNLDMTGQNLYEFLKTANGTLTSELSDISVPVSIKEKNVLEAVFLPLRVIASLGSNTALKFVSSDVVDGMGRIDYMFNQKQRIDFATGKLNIGLNSGVITINEFDFTGITQSPVEDIKASGVVNLDNKALDLNTRTVFAGLIIPVHVGGTINKPKTDTARLTAQILQSNTSTIIKTGLDMSKTVNETVDKIKGGDFQELLKQPVSNDSKEGQGNSLGQFLDSFSGRKKSNQSTKPTRSNNSSTVDQIFGILDKGGQKPSTGENGKKQTSSSEDVGDQVQDLLNF
jgi:hypothetical protein